MLEHCGIDEETIEAFASGRLRDPALKANILTCRKCQQRVAEIQNWNAFVRKANRRLLEVDPASTGDKR
jgi:anti-sigma factor RsiW